jgi:3'-phosphoadenosine 5'-phosphosulfate (PAPS) 3'-phosphatase
MPPTSEPRTASFASGARQGAVVPAVLSEESSVALIAAHEAGQLALSLQGTVASHAKADGSPVSDADLAADRIISGHLRRSFPDDAILSEETIDDPRRLASSRLWIIDPIDGTKDYLAGRPEWAVQIALAIDGVLVLGVLAIPGEGVMISGRPGHGGTLVTPRSTQPLRASGEGSAHDVLIVSSSERNRRGVEQVRAALPEFGVLAATSVGIKVWRMLAGKADLYVHPRRIAEWDVAAPAAVLLAAGGQATTLDGQPCRFNQRVPQVPGIVFSCRPDHDQLISRLRHAEVGVP